ncbi:MAG: hypothetical protein KGJ55_06840 [Gammaproteobacteria bacterium]|nr:hypothetical protein [Gammaproteobacteria bacterium]
MKHLLTIVSIGLLAAFSVTARPAAAADSVRPQVGKPLKAAQSLIREHKYKQALSEIDTVDAVADKTAYEKFLIERMRVAAAIGAGATDVAAKALDAIVATRQMSRDETLKLTRAVVDLYYRDRNYGKAIDWADRYRKAGGSDPALDTLVAQAYYLKGDYAAASRVVKSQIAAVERAGRVPGEQQLQLLVSSELKRHDQADYVRALQQLVTYYPKPNYWNDLIIQTQRQSGFSASLSLDVFRLMLATGTLTKASDYMEMAELALQAGFPAEARHVLERGYANKVLGSGPQAPRQRRLKDLVDQKVAEDRRTLAAQAQQAAGQDGDTMLATGYDLVLSGQAEKGLTLMQRGIAKDKLRYPEAAKLHLGLAYLNAGNKPKALQIFRTVQGHDGAADLARLWMIVAHSAANG